MSNLLYPLKFKPIYKEKIWGGKKLKNLLNKIDAPDNCGESWEISAIQDNISIVSNGYLQGNSLQELIEVYMGDLIGEKIYSKFGLEFPLLLKFIDANDTLSVQVHPDDEIAKKRHKAYGKTEMWYIVDAEPDAKLVSGFNNKQTKSDYLKALNDKKLIDILNFVQVKKDDCFFIPSGRLHAIGKGILLAEIQQTSDITYRIYDWERADKNGKLRELHTDLAMDVIDFEYCKNIKTEYKLIKNNPALLTKNKYFTTNIIEIDKPISRDFSALDSFVIYMCIEGQLTINDYNENINISRGETVLVPAEIQELELKSNQVCKILEVYIP